MVPTLYDIACCYVTSLWSAQMQSWKAVGISQNYVVSLHLAFLNGTPADNLTALEATGPYDVLCVYVYRLHIRLTIQSNIWLSQHAHHQVRGWVPHF